MEISHEQPHLPEIDPITLRVSLKISARFQFGTRAIQATGTVSDHAHPNVLRLRIQQSFLQRAVQTLIRMLSTVTGSWLQSKFPEWFIPKNIVLKSQKPDWEDEFNRELIAYHKLSNIQGIIIPQLYGMIEYRNTRTLVLSDIGGHCLATPQGAVLDKEDLRPLLHQAFTSFAELGAYHDDTKLDNFHLVTQEGKDKIMVVDLESVCFDLSGEELASISNGDSVWLIEQYENHLECMEYDGVILPKRPLRL
ncbi:hypothetical protein HG530_014643 [Fusarium avenaceum]|nr:hypothetical protein HG530_014643 [Fusarium avenaceum]